MFFGPGFRQRHRLHALTRPSGALAPLERGGRPVGLGTDWLPGLISVILAVAGILAIVEPARGQSPIIAVGPPSSQTLAGPSFEDQMLYQMRTVGPRVPGDEVQLARLIELGAIATLASIRNDVRGSVTSAQLEQAGFGLLNATDALDQAVRYLPEDTQNLARAQLALNDVQTAYDRLDSMLGAVPALSPRGALYLGQLSQVLPFMYSVLPPIEVEIAPPAPLPRARTVSLAELREYARFLASEIGRLNREVSGLPLDRRAREMAVAELSRFFELVAGFDRLLAFRPTRREVLDSFDFMKRGAGPARAALIQIERARDWRPLRDGLNAISDALQVSRAMASQAIIPNVLPNLNALIRGIDQASASVSAAVRQPESGEVSEPETPQSNAVARRLQIKLLEFRQAALAGESTAELAHRLQAVEALGQELGRAQAGPAVFRGGRRADEIKVNGLDRTISRLRDLLAG
jgi:hypothetical protein